MTNNTDGAALLPVTPEGIWTRAAEKLGWHWSHAHGGYVCDHHFDADGAQPSEVTAEDACFIDDIETPDEAKALIGASK